MSWSSLRIICAHTVNSFNRRQPKGLLWDYEWVTGQQGINVWVHVKQYLNIFLKDWERDEKRKAIFMDSGIHAREWFSPASCQWFVYQLSQLEHSHNSPLAAMSPALCWVATPLYKWAQIQLTRRAHTRCCQEINALGFTHRWGFYKIDTFLQTSWTPADSL